LPKRKHDITRLREIALLPVRHHSPRASAVVASELSRLEPELVLVEGPSDADDLIPVLVDPETRPPVAILGYRTDGASQSVLWPFASYSPELIALAWASARGVAVRFVDVDIGTALAMEREDVSATETPSDTPSDDGGGFEDEIAARLGLRTFEEAWEAWVEAPRHEAARFQEAITGYAELIRSRGDRARSRQRDAVMAKHVLAAIEAGVAPSRIAFVAGAAHTAAFAAGDVDIARARELPRPAPSARTVIPFSFPRLSEQLGYGAGNRAPRFYQRVHEAGGDVGRATLETLVDLAGFLRLRGFSVSMADTIEAWRLAVALADLRGKPAPGLDEAREAATATYGRGEAGIVEAALDPAAVGHAVGKVATRVGQGPLQAEFWREVKARRLPDRDDPEDIGLNLHDDVQVATSVFLHRLRVAEVPYASFFGAGRMRNAPPGDLDQEPGGIAALSRIRESWTAQWTPATDVTLVEKVVLGDRLEDVCTRLLDRRLVTARDTGDAADVLLEAVVTACPGTVGRALEACDRFAAVDDDLPSLARACAALSALLSYGSSRRALAGEREIAALCVHTFDRALLRLPNAAAVDGDALTAVKRALRALHEVAHAQPRVDRDAWLAAARATAASFDVHPSAAGMATGLLYLAQALSDDDVATTMSLRLSAGNEPAAAAAFLAGFLEVNALVLVKSRPVVAALDAYLNAIPPEGFADLLPTLRRAFADLGATERRYLLENVVSIRGLADRARAAQQVIAESDKQKLASLDKDLAAALDDLDDLL
jgi:hypothetical protein